MKIFGFTILPPSKIEQKIKEVVKEELQQKDIERRSDTLRNELDLLLLKLEILEDIKEDSIDKAIEDVKRDIRSLKRAANYLNIEVKR